MFLTLTELTYTKPIGICFSTSTIIDDVEYVYIYSEFLIVKRKSLIVNQENTFLRFLNFFLRIQKFYAQSDVKQIIFLNINFRASKKKVV